MYIISRWHGNPQQLQPANTMQCLPVLRQGGWHCLPISVSSFHSEISKHLVPDFSVCGKRLWSISKSSKPYDNRPTPLNQYHHSPCYHLCQMQSNFDRFLAHVGCYGQTTKRAMDVTMCRAPHRLYLGNKHSARWVAKKIQLKPIMP